MNTRIFTLLILAVLLAGLTGLAGAQARPDTTHLLEQAGVDPETMESQRAKAPAAAAPAPPVTTYELPFASRDNRLALAVRNTTGQNQQSVSVSVTEAPSWLIFEDDRLHATGLDDGTTAQLLFRFDVNKQAPIGQPRQVTLQAMGPSGMIWEKQLSVRVAPPEQFKLLHNYPNPFSSATTIEYRLPAEMRVEVTIYDMLGRKITTFAERLQAAGQHEVRWDGGGMASGLYFYRVVADGQDGEPVIEQKKMMLVK